MDAAAAPRIKICCIADPDEAALAIALGADALGLVSEMPSGPGVIDMAMIARVAAGVPPPIDTFLLTSRRTIGEIVAQHREARTTTIQLCDRLLDGTPADLRRALPGVRIVAVIHVTGPESVDEALAAATHAHALLLDSGNPALATPELGGTGRRHDWALSRRIREEAPVPIFLAGGLRPDNVREAIATVGPFGLDLCSGVRSGGRLDRARLSGFITAVRGG